MYRQKHINDGDGKTVPANWTLTLYVIRIIRSVIHYKCICLHIIFAFTASRMKKKKKPTVAFYEEIDGRKKNSGQNDATITASSSLVVARSSVAS